jgi:hypothetical protein
VTETPNAAPITEKEAKRQSYSTALTALKEAHPEEFNTLRAKAMKDLGFVWKPKPTAEQQAEADMEALLSKHPELLDKFAERLAQRQ